MLLTPPRKHTRGFSAILRQCTPPFKTRGHKANRDAEADLSLAPCWNRGEILVRALGPPSTGVSMSVTLNCPNCRTRRTLKPELAGSASAVRSAGPSCSFLKPKARRRSKWTRGTCPIRRRQTRLRLRRDDRTVQRAKIAQPGTEGVGALPGTPLVGLRRSLPRSLGPVDSALSQTRHGAERLRRDRLLLWRGGGDCRGPDRDHHPQPRDRVHQPAARRTGFAGAAAGMEATAGYIGGRTASGRTRKNVAELDTGTGGIVAVTMGGLAVLLLVHILVLGLLHPELLVVQRV